jgi:hypothetical protein
MYIKDMLFTNCKFYKYCKENNINKHKNCSKDNGLRCETFDKFNTEISHFVRNGVNK